MSDHPVIESVSIDCVIFGFTNDQLQLLLVKHADGIGKGNWGLPGGWIWESEGLDAAAYRILKGLTGIQEIFLEQLGAFGDVDRFPVKRVITIAYFALVNPQEYELIPGFTATEATWFPIDQLPEVLYDHGKIINSAKEHLRQKVRHEPIGFNLLPEEFTLLDIQKLYEALLQTQLDKSNFRRKIKRMNLLVKSEKKQSDVPHRAAQLYSFDRDIYENHLRNGFNFML